MHRNSPNAFEKDDKWNHISKDLQGPLQPWQVGMMRCGPNQPSTHTALITPTTSLVIQSTPSPTVITENETHGRYYYGSFQKPTYEVSCRDKLISTPTLPFVCLYRELITSYLFTPRGIYYSWAPLVYVFVGRPFFTYQSRCYSTPPVWHFSLRILLIVLLSYTPSPGDFISTLDMSSQRPNLGINVITHNTFSTVCVVLSIIILNTVHSNIQLYSQDSGVEQVVMSFIHIRTYIYIHI